MEAVTRAARAYERELRRMRADKKTSQDGPGRWEVDRDRGRDRKRRPRSDSSVSTDLRNA